MATPPVLQQRLAAQQLLPMPGADPAALVSALAAIQAQDSAMALWAVGIRTGVTRSAVMAALDEGTLIRTHLLRPTWHLVAAADLRWLLALSGPVVQRAIRPHARQFGITEADLKKAKRLFEKVLPGKALTRLELQQYLERAGIATGDFRMAHLLMSAELDGIICSGPRQGRNSTYTLLDERVPSTYIPFEKEAALAELARRYFRTRGPATVADFAWWSGLGTRRCADAVASIQKELEVCGNGMYRIPTGTVAATAAPLLLLPAFDEYLIAYRDRGLQLAEPHKAQVLTRNGIFRPAVIDAGRVCGTWRAVQAKGAVELSFQWLPDARVPGARKLAAAVTGYARFLEQPVRQVPA